MQNLQSKMDAVMRRRPAYSDVGDQRRGGLEAVARELDRPFDTTREALGDNTQGARRYPNNSNYTDRPQSTAASPLSETTCPYCRETIRQGAIICRHCRSALAPEQPALRSDNDSRQATPSDAFRSTPANNAFQRFIDAQKTCWLRKYANGKGRASRSEFWYFYLGGIAINILLIAAIPNDAVSSAARGLFGLAALMPQIAVGIRRLQDTNRSGVWSFLAFTVIGVIPLIYWWAKPGDNSANRFGPPPI